MALFERELFSGGGRRLPFRPAGKRPLNPHCPLHLRRICGVCASFPVAADMRAKAQLCGALQITVNGTRCAASCKLWARKSAAKIEGNF